MNLSLNMSQPDLFVESRTWRVIQGMMTYGVLLLCLLGNSAALRVFMTPDIFSEARHLLLKSLTFCDLIFGIVLLILSILMDATPAREPGNIFIETVIFKLGYIPASCSVVHLIYIGIDRCIAVFLPLMYPQIVTRRRTIQLVLLAWGYSILTCSAFMLYFLYNPDSLEQNKLWVVYAITLYTLLLGFQCIIFVKLWVLIKKKRQEIQCLGGQAINTNTISSFKSSLRLVMFLTTYTTLWTPFIMYDFLTEMSLVQIVDIDTHFIIYTICINFAFLNSFINIFVYAASDPVFRKTAGSIYKMKL